VNLNLFALFQVTSSIITKIISLQLPSNSTVFSAIIYQRINISNTPAEATVKIVTSTFYPVDLGQPTVTCISGPNCGLFGPITVVQVTGPCGTDEDCEQIYEILIDLGSACSVTGVYELDFTDQVLCQNITFCPFNPPGNATIIFSLESENICPIITVNVSLSGTLATFSDPAYTVPKVAFLEGQTVYFLAQLFSLADIISTTVTDISMIRISTGEVLPLRADSIDLVTGLNGLTTTGSFADFSLLLDPSELFIDHSPTGPDWAGIISFSEGFTFSVTILATLEDVNGKREIFQGEPYVQSTQVSTSIALQQSHEQDHQNSHMSWTGPIVGIVVGSVAILLLIGAILFIINRTRAKHQSPLSYSEL